MNGLTDDMLESYMDDLKYREVIIGYKGNRYHIEAYNKKYVVGIFKKKEVRVKDFQTRTIERIELSS